jgi:signal transduction histidine kinase
VLRTRGGEGDRRAADARRSARRRIAHDVHRGVVQDLSGVSFDLAALGRCSSIDPDAVAVTARLTSATIRPLRFVLDEEFLES